MVHDLHVNGGTANAGYLVVYQVSQCLYDGPVEPKDNYHAVEAKLEAVSTCVAVPLAKNILDPRDTCQVDLTE